MPCSLQTPGLQNRIEDSQQHTSTGVKRLVWSEFPLELPSKEHENNTSQHSGEGNKTVNMKFTMCT
jgi:hypothetical protein